MLSLFPILRQMTQVLALISYFLRPIYKLTPIYSYVVLGMLFPLGSPASLYVLLISYILYVLQT